MTDTFASAAERSAPGTACVAVGASPLSGWFIAFREGDAAGYRAVLLLRFAALNLVAVALLAAAYVKGWVDMVLAGDSTQLVAVIALVFLAGLFDCGRKILQTSSELDQVNEPQRLRCRRIASYLATVRHRDGQSRGIAGSALRLRLLARIAPIRHIANSLVFLGLIGTVLGFIIALSGVDARAAADIDSVGPMVSTLIGGMSVALYTTLVGAVLNIWLMLNYRLLEGGTVRLLTAIVELGERNAQP